MDAFKGVTIRTEKVLDGIFNIIATTNDGGTFGVTDVPVDVVEDAVAVMRDEALAAGYNVIIA